jgi:hypothetical protein
MSPPNGHGTREVRRRARSAPSGDAVRMTSSVSRIRSPGGSPHLSTFNGCVSDDGATPRPQVCPMATHRHIPRSRVANGSRRPSGSGGHCDAPTRGMLFRPHTNVGSLSSGDTVVGFLSGPVPAGITRSGDAPERWHSQGGGMGVTPTSSDVLLVHVAPAPVLPRLDRLDDRMAHQVGVGGCVAIRRRVAAADQTTCRAHAEVHPPAPHGHARLAPVGIRDDRTDVPMMYTRHQLYPLCSCRAPLVRPALESLPITSPDWRSPRISRSRSSHPSAARHGSEQ